MLDGVFERVEHLDEELLLFCLRHGNVVQPLATSNLGQIKGFDTRGRKTVLVQSIKVKPAKVRCMLSRCALHRSASAATFAASLLTKSQSGCEILVQQAAQLMLIC